MEKVKSLNDTRGKNRFIKFWNSYFDEQETKILLGIFLFSFIIRLVFILETQPSPFVQQLFSDSKIYNQHAISIVENNNWLGDEVFFMAPVYPYFLAAVYKIFGESTFLIRFLQVVFSSLLIFIIYLIGRNLYSQTVGYTASFISSIYIIFIFYSGLILSETLQTFVIALLILALSRDEKTIDIKDWFFIGLLLGISALFRGNILIFFMAIVVWMVYQYIKNTEFKKYAVKSLAFFILGTILPILPVTLRNVLVADDFVVLTSNGGINFYLGNNEKAIGVFVTPTDFDFANDMAGKKFAEKKTGRKLKSSEASDYWFDAGIDYVVSQPLGALLLTSKKIILFFDGEENPQSSAFDYNFYKDHYSNVLQLPLIDFRILSIFFIAGFVLSWKNKKSKVLLNIFFASYVFSTIIFFVNGRYRLALSPLLIVYAAYAVNEIILIVKEKEYARLKMPAYILFISLFIIYFTVPKPKYDNYDAYRHLGDVAYENKQFDKAIYNYNRSVVIRDHFMTFVNIGNAFAQKKDFKNAIMAFEKALLKNPDYELAHFNMGIVYTQQGDFPKAIDSYNKTIELDSEFAGAYRNLGIIYYVSEKYDYALEFFTQFLEISDDEETKKLVRKDIENILRKMN